MSAQLYSFDPVPVQLIKSQINSSCLDKPALMILLVKLLDEFIFQAPDMFDILGRSVNMVFQALLEVSTVVSVHLIEIQDKTFYFYQKVSLYNKDFGEMGINIIHNLLPI